MIRVWIEASPVMRAGLEALIQAAEGLEVAPLRAHADVVLRADVPGDEDAPAPTVVLSGERFHPRLTGRLAGLGVHAVLPPEAAPEQIIAAVYAASAGLVVVPVETATPLLAVRDPEEIWESLTPREMEALEMMAEGLSNKEIAARLNISGHTAKFHVNSILNKLDAGTRTEAVMRGLRRGLIKV